MLTKALWTGPTIDVIGFSWCRDERKRVGLDSIVSKILCTAHNNELSPTDTTAKDAFDSLREATRLSEERKTQKPGSWATVDLTIDGSRLERWFLKTTLNFSAVAGTAGGWDLDPSATMSRPPSTLVAAAFGKKELKRPLGLYSAQNLGEDVDLADEVHFSTLLAPGGMLVGAMFRFRGLRFLLYLSKHPLTSTILPTDPRVGSVKLSAALYHLSAINWDVGGIRSHYIHFRWPRERWWRRSLRRLAELAERWRRAIAMRWGAA